MSEAYLELGSRNSAINPNPKPKSKSNSPWTNPKLITLGGDHSLALPALRALSKIHGNQPISILHFDAHLDTWHPSKYPSAWPPHSPRGDLTAPSDFNHGSMFHLASLEGLIHNSTSVHGGLRTRLSGDDSADYADDDKVGFLRIFADDIDDIGTRGIIEQIMQRIGTEAPVYLSVDIDVLDPGLAPGTGTPEPGGWTSRELIRILRGVEGLNVVGADVVEVAPMYDNGGGEATALAAAQVVYEILTSMVKRGLKEMDMGGEEGNGGAEPEGMRRDEL
jgi:agmatinase